MNCANHPEAPAIGYCRECGKPLCEACRREAGGTLYCEEHSPVVTPPPVPPPAASPYTAPYTGPDPSPYQAPEATPYTAPQPRPVIADPGVSPGLAFLLGFIPGVGAIYNGQYVKGLIHVVIMGLLISITSNEEMSGNLQPLFGMMIAAWIFYMAFEAYHTAKKRQLGEPVDEFSSIVPRHGQHSRFPLAPTVLIAVGLGVYMLYERVSGSSQPNGHSTPPAGGRP